MPTANIERELELYNGWLKETLCSLVTKPCSKQGSQHTPYNKSMPCDRSVFGMCCSCMIGCIDIIHSRSAIRLVFVCVNTKEKIRHKSIGMDCGIAVADEIRMLHECPVLQPLRQQFAALFTSNTDTLRSLFAQEDHMQVSRSVLDCLDYLTV